MEATYAPHRWVDGGVPHCMVCGLTEEEWNTLSEYRPLVPCIQDDGERERWLVEHPEGAEKPLYGYKSRSDHVYDQHVSGVHVNCGSGCDRAGTVDRLHSHDYEGELVCCSEVPPNAGSAS